jgi:hypothetical protein
MRYYLKGDHLSHFIVENRAYASESATADSMCIAAKPSGRTMKKGWKI